MSLTRNLPRLPRLANNQRDCLFRPLTPISSYLNHYLNPITLKRGVKLKPYNSEQTEGNKPLNAPPHGYLEKKDGWMIGVRVWMTGILPSFTCPS